MTNHPNRSRRAPRVYHVLVARETALDPWGIEFGDYHREVVRAEADHYYCTGTKRSDLKILAVRDDTQKAIEDAVLELNQARHSA